MTHTRWTSSRRQLLSALAAAPLMAPFLRASTARAQSAPKNLVIFTWPDGLEEGWHPQGGETNFQLSGVLAPLVPFQKDLLLIGGLKSGIKNELNAHSEGPHTLWTGAVPGDKGGRSIDETVGQVIGAGAPYKVLRFGVQSNVTSALGSGHVHHLGPGQSAPSEDDPATMYDQIFGKAAPGQDAAKIAKLRRERGSVLDFVKAQLKTVRGEVGVDDRLKVDQHAAGIESIEKSLAALGQVKCESTSPRPALTRAAAMTDANFPMVIKLQTDLMVTALGCGVTRVATLQLSNTDSQTRIPGVNPVVGLHGVMHDRPVAERLLINKFFVERMAYLLERLKGTAVGGGRTLLDDTLVVFGTEMAVGNHKNSPMPFFVAGGGGGYFKLGRWLHLPAFPRHTRLLTSVAHAMGLGAITSYGEFKEADSTGALSEVRG